MARSRNIKPGFFKNETLAECSPLTRLLFAGLWCLADREGRLEDRPKRIRAELLPYDDGSVDDMLNELGGAGFILRYQVGEQRFIQVLNFGRHQTPHHKEQASTIPAPDVPKSTLGHAPDVPKSSRADSLNLIPDSLNHGEPASDDAGSAQPTASHLPACPHQEIVKLYGKHLPTLPQPRIWEGQRADNLKGRWRWVLTAKKPKGERYATDAAGALAFFDRFFGYVAESDFLTGKDGKWSGCDLAWLVKAANFAKVIEGKYENREAA